MKQIYTGYVVDPSIQQPYTAKSVDFLREGDREMIAIIIRNIISNKGLMYSTSVPYFVSGTSNLVGFPTDGAIFFNDELYIMRENTAGLDYCIIDTTPDPVADPVMFTDSISRNVHNNRYLTFTNVASGSLFAIADIVGINLTAPTVVPKPVSAYDPYGNPGVTYNALGFSQSMICNYELFDVDNLYNTTTGIYTCPKTGYYRIHMSYDMYFQQTLTDCEFALYYWVNGVNQGSVGQSTYPYGGNYEVKLLDFNKIIRLNAGDTMFVNLMGSFTSPPTAYLQTGGLIYEVEYLSS